MTGSADLSPTPPTSHSQVQQQLLALILPSWLTGRSKSVLCFSGSSMQPLERGRGAGRGGVCMGAEMGLGWMHSQKRISLHMCACEREHTHTHTHTHT